MKYVRLVLLPVLVITTVSWLSLTGSWKQTKAIHFTKPVETRTLNGHILEKLRSKGLAAKKFVQLNRFNDHHCFLLDMSLPSGQNRFFIYDLKSDSIQVAALVAHGNCFENWLEGRKYSNVVGSGCTSLGRYRIGSSYSGKFGYSYKLHGLDSTNNNAFVRTVVLHAHSCIPDTEVSDEICQSNGCPTVSPSFLQQLKAIINNSGKPILLWIYE
jgi:L,D-transpeptidase catalytic domain